MKTYRDHATLIQAAEGMILIRMEKLLLTGKERKLSFLVRMASRLGEGWFPNVWAKKKIRPRGFLFGKM